MNVLVNAGVLLRSLSVEDAPELFELIDRNREHLGQWLPWVSATVTEGDSVQFLQYVQSVEAKGTELHLGIVQEDHLIGLIGLRINTPNRLANIGYWMAQSETGQGIMTRSVRALCVYAFDSLMLERLELRAATENQASWSIAERLGFTCEGHLRHCECIEGRFVDHYLYSLLQSDPIDWR